MEQKGRILLLNAFLYTKLREKNQARQAGCLPDETELDRDHRVVLGLVGRWFKVRLCFVHD